MPKYSTDCKLKMTAVFIFKIQGTRKDTIFNFLKGRYSVMSGPIDIIFSEFTETCVRLPKIIS